MRIERLRRLAVLASSLSACTTVRSELCATVHSRVMQEQRTTSETPRHLSDVRACQLHARRLRQVALALRELDIREAGLRQAVQGYAQKVEELAGLYARLADMQDARPGASHGEMERAIEALGQELTERAAGLNVPRAILQDQCNAH